MFGDSVETMLTMPTNAAAMAANIGTRLATLWMEKVTLSWICPCRFGRAQPPLSRRRPASRPHLPSRRLLVTPAGAAILP